MKLLDYLKTMTPKERLKFARRAGTTRGYLEQIAYGFKRCGVGEGSKCRSICIASEWMVTPHDLRPDVYLTPREGIPSTARVRPIG